jgi:two-component system, OmpR family, sensor histidine kinase KdpD
MKRIEKMPPAKTAVWISLRASMGLIAVGAITMVFNRVIPVNATTVGFIYLVMILVVATAWGFIESLVASVAAMLSLNYFFLPPVGQFTIADPQNWVALFAFLATSLVASRLSTITKRQAEEAIHREQDIEKLYSFSRAILLIDSAQSAPAQLARQVSQVFDSPSVAIYDAQQDQIFWGGPVEKPALQEALKTVALRGTRAWDEPTRHNILPVNLGGKSIGSLAIGESTISEAALESLANLVAIGLERARSAEAASRAEVSRQSEELKSTLLDAIAHEFKTPLTSIKAAASGLRAHPSASQAESAELLSVVEEESDRLSRLVTEAIQMARIEAGNVRLQLGPVRLEHIAERAVQDLGDRTSDREVHVSIPPGTPEALADGQLLGLVVRHLLDNALKYSPPGTPIELTAETKGDRVVVKVSDHGPGVAEKDRNRVFDKFFRARHHKDKMPGSGMGLAIAREVVQAHKGDIWVEARPGGGAVFSVSLPVAEGVSA